MVVRCIHGRSQDRCTKQQTKTIFTLAAILTADDQGWPNALFTNIKIDLLSKRFGDFILLLSPS